MVDVFWSIFKDRRRVVGILVYVEDFVIFFLKRSSRYLSFRNQSNAHRLLYDMKLNIYEFDFVLHPNFLETFESVISVSLKELSC